MPRNEGTNMSKITSHPYRPHLVRFNCCNTCGKSQAWHKSTETWASAIAKHNAQTAADLMSAEDLSAQLTRVVAAVDTIYQARRALDSESLSAADKAASAEMERLNKLLAARVAAESGP
jgi:hypothetical protein